MAILVRYQCYSCGAPGELGGAAWARCAHCRALLGFDYQAWLESPDYQRYLAQATRQPGRWTQYQALDAEAEKLAAAGRLDEAIAKERR